MIIERYIYREIFQKLVWVMGLLILIVASKEFVDYLGDAAAGKLAGDLVLRIFWMNTLGGLPKLLPVSIFIAVILGFSRMARDQELVSLFAAGIGRQFQLWTTMRFTLAFCLGVIAIVFWLSPWAEGNAQRLEKQAQQEADISGISAGQFKEFSKGDRVVYVEGVSPDKTEMNDIFLQVRQDKRLGVLTSSKAKFKTDEKSGNRFILFENGRRYLGEPGTRDYQITGYQTYAILIEAGSKESLETKLVAIPTAELLAADSPMHKAELQWRISTVIACITLSLLAVLLNQFAPGEKRFAPFVIAVLVYFIYSNLLGISRTLLKRDEIPSMLGLWWVHVLMLLVIAVLYYLPALRAWHRAKSNQQILPAEP